MAFKLGNTTIYPGVLPVPSSTNRGAPLYVGQSKYYFAYPGEISTVPGTGWRYRTNYTHGFLAGGYKGSNVWRSVNKTWHPTDTTYYCGEQLDRGGSYVDGAFSDYNGYIFGTHDSFQGSSSHVSSINLHNGVLRQSGEGIRSSTASNYGYTDGGGNTSDLGGWNLANNIAIGGACTDSPGGSGYRLGGGRTDVERLHFQTEIMYATSMTTGSAGQSVAGWGGELKGWVAMSSSVRHYILWSNSTLATWSPGVDVSTDGQQKTLGSKYGHFYVGLGSNTDPRMSKMSEATGTAIAAMTKLRNYGEENQQMGQDWGYMLGQYDGQQNNHTTKTTYTTDSIVQMGAATMPKGHVGQSSGACFPAAASITSAVMM